MEYVFPALIESDPDGGYLVTFPDVPEVITGLIGVFLIGLSFWWSVRQNRRNPEASEAAPPGG